MRDEEIENLISALSNDGFDPEAFGSLADDDEQRGPPLHDSELRDAHNDLAKWRSPAGFIAAVKALKSRSAARVLFNNPRHKFLLDAWPLAEFAVRHRGIERVRLAGFDDRFPDGYVRIGGLCKNVEVTIADMPGRRMGDEYKSNTGKSEPDPVEDWIARADAIPQALDTAVRKKADKHYGSFVWLLVYLNLGEYGIRQSQTQLVIAQVKQRYAQAFENLFVLWNGKLY